MAFVKLNHFREVFLSPRDDFHVWGVRKESGCGCGRGSGRWFLSVSAPLGAIGCRI